MRHLFERYSLDEITPRLIEKLKQRRIKKAKPAAIDRELACLKHLSNTAIKWEQAEKKPVREVKHYKEVPLDLRVLTTEEIKRLIDACDEKLRPVVVTALHKGMRKHEMLDLNRKSQ